MLVELHNPLEKQQGVGDGFRNGGGVDDPPCLKQVPRRNDSSMFHLVRRDFAAWSLSVDMEEGGNTSCVLRGLCREVGHIVEVTGNAELFLNSIVEVNPYLLGFC